MFFLFSRKERTKEKPIGLFSRKCFLIQSFFRAIYGKLPCFLAPLGSPRASGASYFGWFLAHAYYNLYSFRDSANGVFLFRQVAPAPCSPPLGGSDGYSAVRFTAAVKYGGRENWPPRRETRCIRYHPCRAHHKLKWARKLGRLYSRFCMRIFSRSESSKTIIAVQLRCPPMIRRLPKLHKVNPVRQGLATTP